VIILAGFLVAAMTVPLMGGRLSALAALPLRHGHLVVVAVSLQTVVIKFPSSAIPSWVAEGIHLYTYAMAFGFLAVNRHIRGLGLATIGAVANAVAIAANHGVMPASQWATSVAGLRTTEGFSNSTVVSEARLLFLGDIFAIPASWPLANVFSAGDVALVIGAGILMHRTCGSRLSRPGSTPATNPAAI
jgi:hypothetical protein